MTSNHVQYDSIICAELRDVHFHAKQCESLIAAQPVAAASRAYYLRWPGIPKARQCKVPAYSNVMNNTSP